MKKQSLRGSLSMNWDRLEGEWKQQRGKAVHRWGKMMNDELAAIAGKYEELVGKLQERYGIASDKSDRQASEFKTIAGKLKKSTSTVMKLQRSARVSKAKPAGGKRGKPPGRRHVSPKTKRKNT
jgi:uncharacterized protein YjbJ (UPF0337 family)